MALRDQVSRGSRWLRSNSEHYLLLDAQARMAAAQGRPGPPRPRGAKEVFWLRVFAPTYRRLPWKVRSALIQAMPGSHRQTWTPPAERRNPAI
ncbi:MAG TPA: hypothetical protein VJ622_01600 [Acidimicrobiia bacterium]|nr:hypothetical protein [Acidimicrobiia bacterium]